MEKIEKLNLLKAAHKNYYYIFESNKRKYQFLPEWQNFESQIFIKEINILENNTKNIYKVYERGTIIRVNFGVNIGSELCGPHFAIVLNKDDCEWNKTLQVVPLTSKNKKNRLSIDKEVFERITDNLISKSKEILNKDNDMKKSVIESIDLKKLTKIFIKMLNSNNNGKFLESESVLQDLINILRDDSITTLQESIERSVELFENVLNDSSKTFYEHEKEFLTFTLDYFKNVLPTISENQKRLSDLSIVLEEYQKYSKNSYVCISDIYTISKERIIEMNQYDPSGNIFCSDKTLNIINEGLKQHLICE